MKTWEKRLIIGICCLIFVIIIGLIAVSFYFYTLVIERNDKLYLQKSFGITGSYTEDENTKDENTKKDENLKEEANILNELKGAVWVENQQYEKWLITSYDGLQLFGYYIPAAQPTSNTVILAHGYASRGKDMGIYAEFFYDKLGYNVLLPDARGHGMSEGDYIGFGWPERKDYLIWIEKVIDRVGEDSHIALFGVSMGGATVMMVSGEELPIQVKAIIEDCGYSSASEELTYQLRKLYHLPSFPFIPLTSLITDIRAGYNFYEASAVKQVEKSKLPILFIHGGNDTFVPTEMVYKVFNACKSDKEMLIVEGAGHGLSYTIDPSTYEMKISHFLDRYMS